MLQQKMINFIYVYPGKQLRKYSSLYGLYNEHFFSYWNTFTIFKTRILRCNMHLWNFNMLSQFLRLKINLIGLLLGTNPSLD